MTPATVPAAARGDFPDWLPPMLVKELRQGLRARGFVGLFVTFHLVAVIIFWWTIEMNAASGLRGTFDWLNGLYWTFLNLVLLLVIPIRGLAGLRVEMDSRTLDLLVLTRLSSWRIVMGKWVALMAQGGLFLIALLPYGVTRYFFGSVELMSDLVVLGLIFLFSGMLTACALWISAMPRLFRILMPIVLFLLVQGVGLASVANLVFGGGGSRHPFAGVEWVQLVALLSLTFAFLGLAVRRLAPPAENHALPARSFALVHVLGALLTAAATGVLLARGAVMFAVAVVLIVGAIEMCGDARPMLAHWRQVEDCRLGRLARFLLPGWPSAALFVAGAFALIAVPALFLPDWRPPGASGLAFAWWFVLAWQMLVFPAVLLSFLPAGSPVRLAGTGYFVIQALFGTISLVSLSNSVDFLAGATVARSLESFCRMLPISSFWMSERLLQSGFPGPGFVGQLLMFLLIAALAWRRSRPYWAEVGRFEDRAGGRGADPAS
ncbi:MAG TPA: hypothetical protein VEB66_11340 [Opitutaceae bacterium]|nr:hypothetical protein [Opitutaceae bacterium]